MVKNSKNLKVSSKDTTKVSKADENLNNIKNLTGGDLILKSIKNDNYSKLNLQYFKGVPFHAQELNAGWSSYVNTGEELITKEILKTKSFDTKHNTKEEQEHDKLLALALLNKSNSDYYYLVDAKTSLLHDLYLKYEHGCNTKPCLREVNNSLSDVELLNELEYFFNKVESKLILDDLNTELKGDSK
jgi:hypothetical protein